MEESNEEISRKASKNYSSMTKDAIKYIKDVCNKYGPRISGTQEEREALEELEDNLKEFSDFTYFDTYNVYPTFYPGGFVLMFGILIITSVFTFFLSGLFVFLSSCISAL